MAKKKKYEYRHLPIMGATLDTNGHGAGRFRVFVIQRGHYHYVTLERVENEGEKNESIYGIDTVLLEPGMVACGACRVCGSPFNKCKCEKGRIRSPKGAGHGYLSYYLPFRWKGEMR